MKKNLFLISLIFLSIINVHAEELDISGSYSPLFINPISAVNYFFGSKNTYSIYIRGGGGSSQITGTYTIIKDNPGYLIKFVYTENMETPVPRVITDQTRSGYYIYHDPLLVEYDKSSMQIIDILAPDTNSYYISVNEIKASSELTETVNKKTVTNSAGNLTDVHSLNEFWAEGVKGRGVGEFIEMSFQCAIDPRDEYNITGVIIFNGLFKTQDLYIKNARVKDATLYFDKHSIKITLEDTRFPQIISFKDIKPTKKVKILIDSVYPGEKWEDCCITKVLFLRE